MMALTPQDHDLLVVINSHYVKSKQHYEAIERTTRSRCTLVPTFGPHVQ